METPTLPTNWLAALSNANHDGTTQQIDDAVGNFETENQVFLQKAQAVHQARVQEDDVWQKSQVAPVVKQFEQPHTLAITLWLVPPSIVN